MEPVWQAQWKVVSLGPCALLPFPAPLPPRTPVKPQALQARLALGILQGTNAMCEGHRATGQAALQRAWHTGHRLESGLEARHLLR